MYRLLECTADQYMTSAVKTVTRQVSLRDLEALFETHDFNAFPVVDEAHTLLGIVTKLDLLRVVRHGPQRLLPELSVLWAEHVDDIMRRRVVTLAPDDSVATAVDHMLSSRLRSLPVVEGRGRKARVIGIVSRGDVLSSLMLESNA